jgi:hypothetical protein
MPDRERTHFSPANYNNQLITVIEKGREVLGKIPFEKLPPIIPKNLCEVLRIELYSDGAGI